MTKQSGYATKQTGYFWTKQLGLNSIYQKDANQLETYNVNGISHYIMKNNETHSVAWTNGNIEGHIQGLLSVDDLKKMVDSIYEE